MTVKEIVKKYLDENGFDGLYTIGCGCGKDNLFACGCTCKDCKPAFRIERNNDEPIYSETREPKIGNV